jgi:PIN domain nuclease of toxin-antitoxin system
VILVLDTQAFLWFVLDDARISDKARSVMQDPGNDFLLSAASYWEIAIKISVGKYTLPENFADFMERQIAENDLTVLPITVAHAAVVATLPFHHRDPFDRVIIAQAITERVPVLGSDAAVDSYPVTRVW